MGKYFVRDTPLAGLEREMMLPPNFAPRGSSSAILCGYNPHGAGVDCQSCLDHRRQSRRTLVCLHITERLQAGAVTMVELTAETVRPWKHLGLKQRAVGIAGRTRGFHYRQDYSRVYEPDNFKHSRVRAITPEKFLQHIFWMTWRYTASPCRP